MPVGSISYGVEAISHSVASSERRRRPPRESAGFRSFITKLRTDRPIRARGDRGFNQTAAARIGADFAEKLISGPIFGKFGPDPYRPVSWHVPAHQSECPIV